VEKELKVLVDVQQAARHYEENAAVLAADRSASSHLLMPNDITA